jgi:Zn-dependent M16 (insulinase) family peptidase
MYISHMVPYAIHGGDPLSLFKINEFSSKIREDFKRGGLFENLVNKHLKSNPHYLKLLYTADPQKASREEAAEAKHLKTLAESLSEVEIKHIIKEAEDLKRHQETLQDHTVLPTLTLNDIPKQIVFTDSEVKMVGNVKVHFHEQPTNGISYFRMKVDLKKLP